MQSESARATTAAEARFRINAPNSTPRSVKVIVLDRQSERTMKELAQGHWDGAEFFTASAFHARQKPGEGSPDGWLSDAAGRTRNLTAEINSADLVVMVAAAGESADAASLIGELCASKRVTTVALVRGGPDVSSAALARTTSYLRPWALMLVIANSDDYITDMLTALGA